MVKIPRVPLVLLAVLILLPTAPAGAQRVDDLVNANRIEHNACKYKLARMTDEARYYDRVKAELPEMEKQAAELQGKLDEAMAKHRRASALEGEQKNLVGELPKVEQQCRDAWVASMSSACKRRDQISRRLEKEINPELARLNAEMPALAEDRRQLEDPLTVLKMNLQSRQNYLARTVRPTDRQLAELDGQCSLLEPATGSDFTVGGLTIAASAPEGTVGDEISFRVTLSPADPRARYGYVWSLNGRSFGDNSAGVRTILPGEGVNTVRVVAWRWTGTQWVKTSEASRDITGKARAPQTVCIAGPSILRMQGRPIRATFEARITPETSSDQYGYTWGMTGEPGGTATFNNYSKTQSISVSTPGRYTILVHAWKLVNGRWLFVGKDSFPFAVE